MLNVFYENGQAKKVNNVVCIDGRERTLEVSKNGNYGIFEGRLSINNKKVKGAMFVASWHGRKRCVFIRKDSNDMLTFCGKGFKFA